MMLLSNVAHHAHAVGKAILVPCLTGIGPLLLAVGGLTAFIGYRKDDNAYQAELVVGGMDAPEASTVVAKRRRRLTTWCLVSFIAGVIVTVLAILGWFDLL